MDCKIHDVNYLQDTLLAIARMPCWLAECDNAADSELLDGDRGRRLLIDFSSYGLSRGMFVQRAAVWLNGSWTASRQAAKWENGSVAVR